MSTALLPVDDVIKTLLGKVKVTQKTLRCGLDDALGKILAADIKSTIDVPPAANSAMDGYAVSTADIDLKGAYTVSQRIPAGVVGQSLVKGSVARIFTGAQIPEQSDAVVMQENTEIIAGKVRFIRKPTVGENVRPQGQDISAGSTVLCAGRRLEAEDLSLIASIGIAEVEVFEPLKISIMSTGDELVDPGLPLKPGQIYNSNRYALVSLIRRMGMEVIDIGIVGDTVAETEKALRQAAKVSDCILSTGGVSVGEEDHVRGVVEQLGNLDVWRIAIKPGKPLAFGNVLGVPFFGLPGNPVSTFITFLIIARPYLMAAQGAADVKSLFYLARADFNHQSGNRREYLRVRVALEDGEMLCRKYEQQGSGVMSSVSWANALAEVEVGQQVQPGDKLRYLLLH